jgi:CubicO group peptidase (beta-lactamase class C family)
MKRSNISFSGLGRAIALVGALACGCVGVEGGRFAETSLPVRAALGPFVERGEIAGVVSVLSDADYNVTADCFGYADAENRRPMAMDTVFAIFSMTKTFTGCAIMVAVDRGIMSLDDHVSKYLPEFECIANKVTIRDCMSHMTGISGGVVEIIKRSVPLREAARHLAQAGKCEVAPGTRFRYGNGHIDVAAACLEVASGMPYERFLRENVLDPLGMDDTRFEPTADMVARMAKAYTTKGGPFAPGDDRCCRQLVFPVGHKVYPAAAAGLFSTPRDMIRFSQMLAHHGERKGVRIVSRKTFDEIWSKKQTPEGIEQPYTVGAWIYGDWFGHEGAMRTDQRANLKTGHSRVFFIQTENKAGKAFFDAKKAWHEACDRAQGMAVPFEAGH